ncbi:transglycosylase SLT domain-containing protein [Magnetofaba australis]|uniref:Putative membrane-bound lytic murein transglycosylase C n=1 Tax=Magnetofaba australis IT-1 TaxID=1434232 RepID=A0A1Y2K909_9PROT|nr:transglycosylase SLT domain-containing protein [Magnetofaba australis]OSM07162.1 putative membrane-bound lytic murein transglycosylase C [Magnetofaba australis IT-1]
MNAAFRNRRAALRALALMGGGLLLRPTRLWAGDPAVDAMERMQRQALGEVESDTNFAFDELDARIRAAFDLLERQTRAAFAQAQSDAESIWQAPIAPVELPGSSHWVGYDAAQQGRVTVDYAQETVLIEKRISATTPQQAREEMQQFANKLADQTPAQTGQMDPVRKRLEITPDSASEQQIAQMGVGSIAQVVGDGDARKTADAVAKELAYAPIPQLPPKRRPQTSKADIAPRKRPPVMAVRVALSPRLKKVSAQVMTPHAKQFAKRYKLPPSLILGVTQTESDFNPRAVSPIPAYGLMQLVPTSGGADAYAFVHGVEQRPSKDLLFQPVANTELGAGYLHLLHYRYLRFITNPLSRRYCAIAGYNTGAGNVARAFGHRNNIRAAARVINALTPEQVLARLIRDLPYAETQRYVQKVLKYEKNYLSTNA